jgi:hypothetical protein
MIRFSCPTCNTILNCPDDKAGGKAPCPTCGQRLQVPVPPRPTHAKTVLGQLVDLPPSNPQSAPPPDAGSGIKSHSPPVQPPTDPPAPDTVTATCPGCGRVIPLSPNDLDILIQCKRCATQFVPSARSSAAPGERPSGQDAAVDDAGLASNWSVGRFLGRGGKHSGLGMASFLIAVLVGGLDIVLGLITVLNIAGSKGKSGVEDSALGGAMAVVCLNCLSIPLCLIGVGLAVMALIAHKGRNHLMTYIGLGVNALVILGVLGLYLLASVSRH